VRGVMLFVPFVIFCSTSDVWGFIRGAMKVVVKKCFGTGWRSRVRGRPWPHFDAAGTEAGQYSRKPDLSTLNSQPAATRRCRSMRRQHRREIRLAGKCFALFARCRVDAREAVEPRFIFDPLVRSDDRVEGYSSAHGQNYQGYEEINHGAFGLIPRHSFIGYVSTNFSGIPRFHTL
jgi:hypothetical protein